jgi:2,3-dihydroxybiphenyl 1,2-dioxygenase
VRSGADLLIRLDSRPYRYCIRPAEASGMPVLGWLAGDADRFALVRTRIEGLGFQPERLADGDMLDRRVADGFGFRCGNGIRHEVVHGIAPAEAFRPPEDVTGYVTGAGGMGHSVWKVPDVEAMDMLMIEVLGMSLREDIPTPLGVGHFYGCNPRHHSLAVFSAPQLSFEHIMVEMRDSDDVGLTMDRVADGDYPVIQPLGRHRTDHMMSFYVRTPSGFGMEIGCEGVLCGDDWADVRSRCRKRPWGHGDAMRGHHKARVDARASKAGAGRPV